MNFHNIGVLLKNATATRVQSVAGMSQHESQCAIAVPHLALGFMQVQEFVRGVRSYFVRAGWPQVIDVSSHCS
jgi:hypothetical protein